jgi:tetratricopeptide (TPR) repeat protein
MTAAERRAAEVRATRAPREPRPEPTRPEVTREEWIDEGSIREEATRAAGRARSTAVEPSRRVDERVEPGAPRRRSTGQVAPEVREELEELVPAARLDRYQDRLAAAADALDRGRFADARRLVQPVLRELPEVAFAHELAGLALYRMGRWKQAANELESARRLDGSVRHHAVLADCYRALTRYRKVEELWLELREASPDQSLMAEGRIVAAGALADQGDLPGALAVMKKAMELPETSRRKVHDHHLRQWYVVADLFDRMGDVVSARRWFRLVAGHDADFADVTDRLRSLGR